MILIRFPNAESKRDALGRLAGRFAFKSESNGEMLVPEDALPFLAVNGIAFAVEGSAIDEQNGSAFRGVAAVAPAVMELKPETEEYDRKNTRRFELIEKRVDDHLTAEEEAEFQGLQAEILAVTKKHFPRPRLNREDWQKEWKEGGGREA